MALFRYIETKVCITLILLMLVPGYTFCKSDFSVAYQVDDQIITNYDIDQIRSIYSKSSINQLIIGGLMFLGIWLNIDDGLSLLPEKFQGGRLVVLFIAFSQLFNVTTGVNGIIVPESNSASINSDTIKASAGAVFYIPISKVNHLNDAIYELKSRDFEIIGLDEKSGINIFNESYIFIS